MRGIRASICTTSARVVVSDAGDTRIGPVHLSETLPLSPQPLLLRTLAQYCTPPRHGVGSYCSAIRDAKKKTPV
eukprot:3266165-Rhodomonas_salina.1